MRLDKGRGGKDLGGWGDAGLELERWETQRYSPSWWMPLPSQRAVCRALSPRSRQTDRGRKKEHLYHPRGMGPGLRRPGLRDFAFSHGADTESFQLGASLPWCSAFRQVVETAPSRVVKDCWLLNYFRKTRTRTPLALLVSALVFPHICKIRHF